MPREARRHPSTALSGRIDAPCPEPHSRSKRSLRCSPQRHSASPRLPPVARQRGYVGDLTAMGGPSTMCLLISVRAPMLEVTSILAILAEDRPTLRAVNPTTWIAQTDYRELE